ncbi:branched-chain amino acid ABC transporter permease [Opitutus sp. GAS368]|uniref:branched-chain amino acid ABC transporter permease n=1 Tax=Opitutus sp. GAS368 TaxID=1882749 RepID=UPI00087DC48E|nr:branched-chain amino acid ABC transporter permease [Opitutus sp. GAS368]SDR80890.1 amino acid/amide ABC transporter membrane protein 1, HAAT family [Opitutus sp. GAS368]
MSEYLQQLLNGLSLGAIYALIALGYTMVYGVLRFINFAHSDVFMVGAFIGYYIGKLVPENTVWGGLVVLIVAMLGCAVLGMVIERLAYRPLRGAATLNVLITAIGVSLLLEYSGQVFFGATPRTFPAVFPSVNFTLGGLVISSNQVVVIVVTALLMVGLQLIVYRTKMGTAMRAVSLNPKAAQLVGINNDIVISFTFGLGSALAAAGGILYALNYPSIDPLMGVMPGLKAFVAAVLGGIGNIPGAALGGLLLGTVETFVNGSQWSTYKDAIAFAILIIILLFRPAGLLGKSTVEKV